jgi:hypothetical protein
MNDVSYSLPTFGTILGHFPGLQPVVRDAAAANNDDVSEWLIRARVRSGDYFVTLATELDKIAQSLSGVRAPEAPELERVVSELLYINDSYTLTKK